MNPTAQTNEQKPPVVVTLTLHTHIYVVLSSVCCLSIIVVIGRRKESQSDTIRFDSISINIFSMYTCMHACMHNNKQHNNNMTTVRNKKEQSNKQNKQQKEILPSLWEPFYKTIITIHFTCTVSIFGTTTTLVTHIIRYKNLFSFLNFPRCINSL